MANKDVGSTAEFNRKVDGLLRENWSRLTARQQWDLNEREFREYLGTARWDELPALCQRSLVRSKASALGMASLSAVERRALNAPDAQPIRVLSKGERR